MRPMRPGASIAHDRNLTDLQRSFELERIYRKGQLTRPADLAQSRPIRILTWNIERGYDPSRIVAALESVRPDVACLQEVDWGNKRTRSLDVLDYIAGRTGMLGLFGIEFLELNAPSRGRRLGGGATGNAILTRIEPQSTFRVTLPACVDWERDPGNPALSAVARWRLRREPRIGQRFGLGVELAIGQQTLIVCSLHLEDKLGGVNGRWAQYRAAADAVDARGTERAIRVLAGDFNTFDSRLSRLVTGDTDATALGKPPSVSEAEWWKSRLLPATGYQDPFAATDWTFSVTPFFRAKLDWITAKGSRIRNSAVGPFATSDHRLLWLDLDLED